mgnify:CR=1 FL=1|tara:strand:+ start:4218 stop:4580 length:363 start_codon:yes stop_codon:yes gene_type:complete
MKFRSRLEECIAKTFDKKNIPYLYESRRLSYVLTSNYTPDFFINDLIIEAKGFFKPSDRRKMLAIKDQHPELDIRFIFQRNNTLSKNSKTTYGDWATKHGFPYCVYPNIPESWLQQPTKN